MTRILRLLLLCLCLLLTGPPAVVAATASGGASSPTADVHGDDEADRYVGQGGLLLPGTVDTRTRRRVAECLGCAWRLSEPCLTPEHGNPFDGQSRCASVVRGCPSTGTLLRSWFRPADGPWQEVGLVCIGPAGPVTVAQLGARAQAAFAQDAPRLQPSAAPPTGVVAQLPVLFDSGQPRGPLARRYSLLSEEVALTATPRWRWEFGDGAILVTRQPGGPFPQDDVAHAYRWSGRQAVVVRTSWSAVYTVDGFGPFDIEEPVEQSARLAVDVGEGRALLAPR